MHSSLRATPVRPSAPLCRALEAIEAASAHAQHLAAPPAEAKRLGLRTERYGSTTAILMRKSRNLMYNRLIGWGQASAATVAQLHRFITFAQTHRAEAVGVPLGPCARPARLREWLLLRGFESGHPGAKLWRDDRRFRRRRPDEGSACDSRAASTLEPGWMSWPRYGVPSDHGVVGSKHVPQRQAGGTTWRGSTTNRSQPEGSSWAAWAASPWAT